MTNTDLTTTHLGRTIRMLRVGRGWTLRFLADRCAYDAGYLSRIENGLVPGAIDNGPLLRQLAEAFGVTVAEVKGQPLLAGDPSTDLVRHMLPRIRVALTGGADDFVGEARPTHILTEEADRIMQMRMAADYEGLAAVAPSLIAHAWARTVTGNADEQAAAYAALCKGSLTVSMALRGLGWTDLAYIAARVAQDAAAELGDPVHVAAAEWAYAHTLLAQGSTKRALAVTNRAINLDGLVATDEGRQIAGMHHLSGALMQAAAGDGSAADNHIVEARDLSGDTDTSGRAFLLYFTPGNINVHAASAALELRDFGRVVEMEDTVVPERDLAVPERRARWHIERTRGYFGVGDDDAAWNAAIEAYEASPTHTPSRPVFRNVVGGLVLNSHGRTLHPQRARLARLVGALAPTA